MQNLSAYAKDYTDFSAPIDFVDEHGCPAHMLDVSLSDPTTGATSPGSIMLEWDCGTAALPSFRRQPGNVGSGREEVHAIRRDQVIVGNVRKLLVAEGVAVVRAHFPYKKRPEQEAP